MKIKYIIFFILIVSTSGYSQTIRYNIDTVHSYFKGPLDWNNINNDFEYYELPGANNQSPRVVLGIYHSNNIFTRSALVKDDGTFQVQPFLNQKNFGRFYRDISRQGINGALVFDSSYIIVVAEHINSKNAAQYEFRVFDNKKEVIPWSPVKLFIPTFVKVRRPKEELINETAYLGTFKAGFGSTVLVELRDRQAPQDSFYVLASWIKRSPQIIATYAGEKIKDFIEVFKFQWKHDFFTPGGATYYGDIPLPPVDSLITKDTLFQPSENSIFFYLRDNIKKADFVEYRLVDGNDSSEWRPNDFDPNVIWLRNLAPGKYKLLLRYSLQRQTISEFRFEVLAAWYQTTWFKIAAGLVSLLALFSIFLLLKNRRQQARLKKQQIQQQITQAEIKSIKSQFNPHFVFNALTSIQGLVTKNDMEAAHKYLNDFSMLLRNSLNQSENEFISMSEEMELINNYLKLEQLRFGFKYDIEVDERIDKYTTEMPVLLLQPVIENAIKHGISKLYKEGNLLIRYAATGENIVVVVEDNGGAFNADAKKGMGLKLTAERVDLLNGILKTRRISWEIKQQEHHTQVIFIFKNWLL